MAEVWDYQGYQIDEGLKPRNGNYKADFYQYFFIVKKDGERVMKFCVWAPRDDVPEIEGASAFLDAGNSAADFVRNEGLKEVKERIDTGMFENTLLEMTRGGRKLVPLDEADDKLQ